MKLYGLIYDEDSYWIVLLNDKDVAVKLFYGEYPDTSPRVMARVVGVAICHVTGVAPEITFGQIGFENINPPDQTPLWRLTSPMTGREYVADMEGDALQAFLNNEPLNVGSLLK